jgi:prepilin-type N-terminal cleavage/methylation domain-containing protein
MRAFTLTELLLVIVLIGILSGGAVVSLRGRGQVHALAVAAKDLAATVEYGREYGPAHGRACRLAWLLDHRAYWLEEAELSDGAAFTPLRGRCGQGHSLPESVRLAAVRDTGGPLDPLPDSLTLSGQAGSFAGTIELQASAGGRAVVTVVTEARQVTYEIP